MIDIGQHTSYEVSMAKKESKTRHGGKIRKGRMRTILKAGAISVGADMRVSDKAVERMKSLAKDIIAGIAQECREILTLTKKVTLSPSIVADAASRTAYKCGVDISSARQAMIPSHLEKHHVGYASVENELKEKHGIKRTSRDSLIAVSIIVSSYIYNLGKGAAGVSKAAKRSTVKERDIQAAHSILAKQ